MIHRYSSRRSPLKNFLATRLQGVCRYNQLAGFFSSSLLAVACDTLKLFVLTIDFALYITDWQFVINKQFCV